MDTRPPEKKVYLNEKEANTLLVTVDYQLRKLVRSWAKLQEKYGPMALKPFGWEDRVKYLRSIKAKVRHSWGKETEDI